MSHRLHVRSFLNGPNHHAGAYIIAAVENSEDLEKHEHGQWPWVDVTLKMADCDRVVSFQFGLDDADDRENSLNKIDRLIDVLSLFRDALYQEAVLAEKRELSGELPA